MKHDYKNLIFTDHALQQMRKRRIKREMVYDTIHKPDNKEPEEADKFRFIRVIDDRNVHVVASFAETQKKWLVVTAWVRGEDDPRPLAVRVLLLPIRMLRVMWRMLRLLLQKVLWPVGRGVFNVVARRGKAG